MRGGDTQLQKIRSKNRVQIRITIGYLLQSPPKRLVGYVSISINPSINVGHCAALQSFFRLAWCVIALIPVPGFSSPLQQAPATCDCSFSARVRGSGPGRGIASQCCWTRADCADRWLRSHAFNSECKQTHVHARKALSHAAGRAALRHATPRHATPHPGFVRQLPSTPARALRFMTVIVSAVSLRAASSDTTYSVGFSFC